MLVEQLDMINQQELDDVRRCKSRLIHVQNLGVPERDAALEHCRQRVPVLLVDYLLRSGQYLTAHQLASQTGVLVSLADMGPAQLCCHDKIEVLTAYALHRIPSSRHFQSNLLSLPQATSNFFFLRAGPC